jgi:hypothetical protein
MILWVGLYKEKYMLKSLLNLLNVSEDYIEHMNKIDELIDYVSNNYEVSECTIWNNRL